MAGRDARPTEFSRNMKVLSFHHQKERFCIKLSDVSEVVQDPVIVSLPRIPDPFDGIFQLRGRVVTVLNFAKCMGGAAEDIVSQILVFAEPRQHFSMRVPGLLESLSLEFERMEVPGTESEGGTFLEGIVYDGQEIYHVLSALRIFSYARKLALT